MPAAWPGPHCPSASAPCRGGRGSCEGGGGGGGGGRGSWRGGGGGGRRRRRRRRALAAGWPPRPLALALAHAHARGGGDMSLSHPWNTAAVEEWEPVFQPRGSDGAPPNYALQQRMSRKRDRRVSYSNNSPRDALILRRGLTDKFYHQQGALKVLLVFAKDDATVAALRSAAGQLGYECSLARNSASCVDAFQSRCHDLVIVDNRDPKTLDGEAIGKALRAVKSSQFSVFVALVKRSETEKQDCSILPYINAGYDRWVVEVTSAAPFVSELLQMDTSEVQPRKQLWAYHSFLLMAERSRELCIITDYSHHIVYANRAVERAVGSSAKELYGRCVYDLVHVDSRERLLNAAVKGREWEGVATVAPRRNSETMMLQCRVMPNGAVGRAPANLVFMLEPPPKRGSEAGMSGRGSVPSVRRGSADMRSVCSDERSVWAICRRCLCCRRLRKGRRRSSAVFGDQESACPSKKRSCISADSGDSLRRQSVTKLNALSIEAPITKVVTLISQAQEQSSPEVSLMLDKVVDILRTTELYSPVVREDRLRPDDPVTSDLISALLQAGSSIVVPTTRRSSNDSAVGRGVHAPRGSRSVPNVSTQLSVLLESSLLWEFDIFKLEELSGQRPLLHLGMNLMEHFEVPQTLNVDMNTVHNWLSIIEMNYRATNTYHNSSHAADVMQSSAAFLERERLQRILDPLDNACCLIAAAVHDVDHPGRSSAFLCNSDHELAILYNDICVLESHHAALAFRLTVSDERVNIFKGLERDVYKMVRLSIIDMVLATEMTKHFEHLAKFVNVFSKPVREDDESSHNRSRRSLLQLGADTEGAVMTQENIALAKRMLIKCADVSNPARPLRQCVEWALRIAEEYFQQTDEEKSKQLPVVMPMFDRASCSIPKSQIGFMDFIINDMFEAWEAFLDMPQLKFYLDCNYMYWRELEYTKILRVDVDRMLLMIKRLGWYGQFRPLPMCERGLPFMTDLAKQGLLDETSNLHEKRVSETAPPGIDVLEIFNNLRTKHTIPFPTRSAILKKNGPGVRVIGVKSSPIKRLHRQEILKKTGEQGLSGMENLKKQSEISPSKEMCRKTDKERSKPRDVSTDKRYVKLCSKSCSQSNYALVAGKSICKISEENLCKREARRSCKGSRPAVVPKESVKGGEQVAPKLSSRASSERVTRRTSNKYSKPRKASLDFQPSSKFTTPWGMSRMGRRQNDKSREKIEYRLIDKFSTEVVGKGECREIGTYDPQDDARDDAKDSDQDDRKDGMMDGTKDGAKSSLKDRRDSSKSSGKNNVKLDIGQSSKQGEKLDRADKRNSVKEEEKPNLESTDRQSGKSPVKYDFKPDLTRGKSNSEHDGQQAGLVSRKPVERVVGKLDIKLPTKRSSKQEARMETKHSSKRCVKYSAEDIPERPICKLQCNDCNQRTISVYNLKYKTTRDRQVNDIRIPKSIKIEKSNKDKPDKH